MYDKQGCIPRPLPGFDKPRLREQSRQTAQEVIPVILQIAGPTAEEADFRKMYGAVLFHPNHPFQYLTENASDSEGYGQSTDSEAFDGSSGKETADCPLSPEERPLSPPYPSIFSYAILG